MTTTQSLNLYDISLRYFKSEADARAFVKEIEVTVDSKFESERNILATKEDLVAMRKEIADSRVEVIKWMIGLFIPLYLSIIGLIITLLVRH